MGGRELGELLASVRRDKAPVTRRWFVVLRGAPPISTTAETQRMPVVHARARRRAER